MLPRIVLFIIQLAAAWFLADPIKAALPSLLARPYDIFVYALIYAAIIVIVGFAGALVMKGLRLPTAGTFIASLALAAILSAITLFSEVRGPVEEALPLLRSNPKLYPLVGAIVGYILKR